MERTRKPEEPIKDEEPVADAKIEPIKEVYVDPDPILTWKKIGGSSLKLPNRLIPPGATFKARASEISKAFRDVVILLDKVPEASKPPEPKPVKSSYSIQPRGKSKSLFDVVDSFGKVINEKPLPKAVAEQLKADLG